MRRRKHEDHANHERWLVSYADFITLLFAFFVVLFASSQVDKKKIGSLAAYFAAYIKDGKVHVVQWPESDAESPEDPLPPAAQEARTTGELARVKEALTGRLAQEIADGKIALSLQPRGLVLSVRESALFPPGRDTFSAGALPVLTKVGEALQKLPGQPVRLEGHTDNVPINTEQFPSNWELSAARAIAVLELLAKQFQISPDRMAAAGHADLHPVANNETADGRARNRRVDIVVLSRSAAAMEPKQLTN